MPGTREIRRRIKSVKNTRQITRAMELVAAAKMRKAQQQALATRTYARLAWQLLQNATYKADPRIHKLLNKPKTKKNAGVVLITSNRGLIGSFNNNVIGAGVEYAKRMNHAEFITLGKKGRDSVRKQGFGIAADFEKLDAVSDVMQIAPLSKLLTDEFISGRFDKVVIAYVDFISTLVQKPRILHLLPIHEEEGEELGAVGLEQSEKEIDRNIVTNGADYIYEPSADEVLEVLIPRLVEMQIYQALLETNAAEHSARMVAMKNASEAASDLVDDLTLEYNQIRQSAITKEISEIVAGRLALEK